MKQDKGHKKQIIATGQTVETTGSKLLYSGLGWHHEVKYKNGKKAWFYDHDLTNITNSK